MLLQVCTGVPLLVCRHCMALLHSVRKIRQVETPMVSNQLLSAYLILSAICRFHHGHGIWHDCKGEDAEAWSCRVLHHRVTAIPLAPTSSVDHARLLTRIPASAAVLPSVLQGSSGVGPHVSQLTLLRHTSCISCLLCAGSAHVSDARACASHRGLQNDWWVCSSLMAVCCWVAQSVGWLAIGVNAVLGASTNAVCCSFEDQFCTSAGCLSAGISLLVVMAYATSLWRAPAVMVPIHLVRTAVMNCCYPLQKSILMVSAALPTNWQSCGACCMSVHVGL